MGLEMQYIAVNLPFLIMGDVWRVADNDVILLLIKDQVPFQDVQATEIDRVSVLLSIHLGNSNSLWRNVHCAYIGFGKAFFQADRNTASPGADIDYFKFGFALVFGDNQLYQLFRFRSWN